MKNLVFECDTISVFFFVLVDISRQWSASRGAGSFFLRWASGSGSMTQPPLFEALHQAAMLTWPQIGVGP